MKVIKHSDLDFEANLRAVVGRADLDLLAQDEIVREILKQIKERGDAALLEYTRRFDQYDLSAEEIRVTRSEIDEARNKVSDEEVDALRQAAENIREFHEHQNQQPWEYEKYGVLLGQSIRPLEAAGIYVPGGKASYPSSVLMNAIPAKVAGVEKVVMCSPASKGQCSPHVLVAA